MASNPCRPHQREPDPPKHIWLQPESEDYRDGWTWCWHEIAEEDIEYVELHEVQRRFTRFLDDDEVSAVHEMYRCLTEVGDPYALPKTIEALMRERVKGMGKSGVASKR